MVLDRWRRNPRCFLGKLLPPLRKYRAVCHDIEETSISMRHDGDTLVIVTLGPSLPLAYQLDCGAFPSLRHLARRPNSSGYAVKVVRNLPSTESPQAP